MCVYFSLTRLCGLPTICNPLMYTPLPLLPYKWVALQFLDAREVTSTQERIIFYGSFMNLVLFINFCLHCPGKLLFCNLEFEKLNCVLSSDLLSLKGLRELEPEEIDDWLLFITVSSFPPSLLSSECSVATPLYPVTLRVPFFSCPPPPRTFPECPWLRDSIYTCTR